mgnify:CR=1 FL=1
MDLQKSPEQFLTISWPVEGGLAKVISPFKSNVRLTESQPEAILVTDWITHVGVHVGSVYEEEVKLQTVSSLKYAITLQLVASSPLKHSRKQCKWQAYLGYSRG